MRGGDGGDGGGGFRKCVVVQQKCATFLSAIGASISSCRAPLPLHTCPGGGGAPVQHTPPPPCPTPAQHTPSFLADKRCRRCIIGGAGRFSEGRRLGKARNVRVGRDPPAVGGDGGGSLAVAAATDGGGFQQRSRDRAREERFVGPVRDYAGSRHRGECCMPGATGGGEHFFGRGVKPLYIYIHGGLLPRTVVRGRGFARRENTGVVVCLCKGSRGFWLGEGFWLGDGVFVISNHFAFTFFPADHKYYTFSGALR